MNYMNIVLIRIYRPPSNLFSSYCNEPMFWMYMLQKTTMSQQ